MPGLSRLGLLFQYSFTSMLVHGAGRDAAHVVDRMPLAWPSEHRWPGASGPPPPQTGACWRPIAEVGPSNTSGRAAATFGLARYPAVSVTALPARPSMRQRERPACASLERRRDRDRDRSQICYVDAYAQSVEATVRHVEIGDVPSVVLDATVFYPGGGGQPSDRGLLLRADDGRTWIVRAARKVEGEIVHELEPSEGDPPAEGDGLTVDLDWARRLSLMRTHTALHALSGVVWRDHGAQVTGSNMEPGSGRLDFELESITGDLVDAIEATVNVELAAARDVRVDVLPREAAFAIPDLIRTKVNLLPPGIEEVRTIEFVGLDLQADSGTHVANTREVGRVRVTGYELKGRINKRIRIAIDDGDALG